MLSLILSMMSSIATFSRKVFYFILPLVLSSAFFEVVVTSGYGYIINFHTQKKEEVSATQPQPPMYHVLLGPTPVESEPDTQEVAICGVYLHTIVCIYSVVLLKSPFAI